MRQVIRFEPNQPVTVALEFPDGVNVVGRGGPQVRYFLTQNRIMYLDPEPARALAVLKVQPGESFTIEKKTAKGKSPWWDFARVKSAGASSEGGDSRLIEGAGAVGDTVPALNPAKPPAIELTSPQVPKTGNPQTVLDRTIGKIDPGQDGREAPPTRGTGTHGPAAAYQSGLSRVPPRIPFNVAFREILGFVTAELKTRGEQWDDGAKQAAVCTLLIQAGKQGWLGPWERAA